MVQLSSDLYTKVQRFIFLLIRAGWLKMVTLIMINQIHALYFSKPTLLLLVRLQLVYFDIIAILKDHGSANVCILYFNVVKR